MLVLECKRRKKRNIFEMVTRPAPNRVARQVRCLGRAARGHQLTASKPSKCQAHCGEVVSVLESRLLAISAVCHGRHLLPQLSLVNPSQGRTPSRGRSHCCNSMRKNVAAENYQLKDQPYKNLVNKKTQFSAVLFVNIPVEQLFPRPLGDDRDDKRGCIEGG